LYPDAMRLPGPDALRHPDDTRLTDGMDYTRYDALLGELVSRGFVALSIDMLPFTTMPSAQRGLHAGYGHPWWDMDPLLCADYDWAAFGMMLADAWLPWFWEHRRILGSGLGRFFIGHSMSAGPVANAALQTNATAFGLLGPAFVDRPPEGTSQVPLMVLIGDDDWVNGFGNMQAWTEYEELSESYENLAVGIVGKQVGHWDYTQGRIWACYGPNVDGRGDPCCVLGPRDNCPLPEPPATADSCIGGAGRLAGSLLADYFAAWMGGAGGPQVASIFGDTQSLVSSLLQSGNRCCTTVRFTSAEAPDPTTIRFGSEGEGCAPMWL